MPLRQDVTDIGHPRDFGESERRHPRSGNDKAAAFIGEVLGRHLHHLGGDLLRLLDDASGTDVDGRSADRHRTRIERAVPGLDLLRVALHNVDVLDRNLQDISGDLRQRSRMPVTVAHRARIQCRAAT
jgi:hypothetical protein